jgi:hypothetical protein
LSAIWASSHRTAPPSPNAPRFFEGKNDKQLMMPPSLQAPMDWAASSTTGCSTLGSVAGRPNRWTGIKARVLALQAAAAAAGSRLKLSGSTSANTGRAPSRAMQPTVA